VCVSRVAVSSPFEIFLGSGCMHELDACIRYPPPVGAPRGRGRLAPLRQRLVRATRGVGGAARPHSSRLGARAAGRRCRPRVDGRWAARWLGKCGQERGDDTDAVVVIEGHRSMARCRVWHLLSHWSRAVYRTPRIPAIATAYNGLPENLNYRPVVSSRNLRYLYARAPCFITEVDINFYAAPKQIATKPHPKLYNFELPCVPN
jgi:hypothetical protein